MGLLAVPASVRLGWKRLKSANFLAYNATEFITDVKKFYDNGPITK